MAGWGAAVWSPEGELLETSRGYLGEGVSNNVAEYSGLEQCMRKALNLVPSGGTLVFELDSKLLARQIQVFGLGKFACRSEVLRPFFLRCIQLGWQLSRQSVNWTTQHIYHECNQVADTLANEAIDRGGQDWTLNPQRARS